MKVDFNPVARLLGIALMTTPLMLSIDWVSATVALVATVLLAPLCGVGPLRLAKRGWPILVAAPLAAISIALYGAPQGRVYLDLGLMKVTENSIRLAQAIFLRVLAIGLPVVVLSVEVDPTDLGAGLVQILHLPAKFVLATVASVRMVSLLQDDLRQMRASRRSRGLADRTGPRYWLSVVFGLLVTALRRGSKLATAMDARGFENADHRTWSRRSRLGAADWALMAGCLIVGEGSLVIAGVTGHFRLFGV